MLECHLVTMLERFEVGTLTWIDALNPTSDEVREILDELDIKPHLASDLSQPTRRAGAESTEKTLKISFGYPVAKKTERNRAHEIKFLVTKNYVVTTHYDSIEELHRFKKEFEVRSTLHKYDTKNVTAVHILFSILHHLMIGLHRQLDYLDDVTGDIDDAIHAEKEREMVHEISQVNRSVIAFKHTIHAYEHVLSDMHSCITKPFGAEFVPYVKDLSRSYHQVARRIRALSDTVDELRDTNLGILSTKQNEVMKILTIMAFTTFPLTLFTSMFGMNTKTTPIVGQDGDFWIILGIMVFVCVGFFAYFRHKRWL